MMADLDNEVNCPYLGLKEDPETRLTFPSLRHYCQNAEPVQSVNLEHQALFCLTANHPNCPVFSNANQNILPEEISITRPGIKRPALTGIVLSIGVLIILVVFNWWQFGDANALPSTPQPEEINQNAPIRLSPTVLLPSTAVPTNNLLTEKSVPSLYLPGLIDADLKEITEDEGSIIRQDPTRLPYPAPVEIKPTEMKNCRVPSGWVTYAVQSGDTLYEIALTTGTTVAELQSANCMTTTIIWVGQRLYVPRLPRKIATPTKAPTRSLPPPVTQEPPPAPTEAPTAYPYP
jgi:hypothetical protein